MLSSADGKFTRYGNGRDGESRRWGVNEMGSSVDGEFTRSKVDEMGS